MTLYKLLAILIGGASGTVLRYWVSGWAQRLFVGVFPWGTLAVNLIGSFIIGFTWGLLERGTISVNFRLFLFVGLFGGFTTFSSFTLECLTLIKSGHIKYALLYIGASNILGLILVYFGYILARMLTLSNR
ncbi:MAG: fluoride efflux transporter CrcB [Bacteroidetes bacterium]|nr:fluoride efflux transporter CrcB [Bacteroidota bacterium]